MLKILQLFLYFMANNFCIHCRLLIFHISIFSKILITGPITTKLGRNVYFRWYFQRLDFFKSIENSSCRIFFKWQALSKEFQNFMFIIHVYIDRMSAIYTLVYYYLNSVKLYFKLKNYCWFYSHVFFNG